MTLIITENINPADQEELLAGLREFNLRFLDPAQFGELGVYSRDAAGAMRGGLIGKRKGSWLCIDYLWVSEALRGSVVSLPVGGVQAPKLRGGTSYRRPSNAHVTSRCHCVPFSLVTPSILRAVFPPAPSISF